MASTNRERFDIVNGKQLALLIAPVLSFVAASIAVASRWCMRSQRRVNTVMEDALCLGALAMSFAVITLVYILVFLCGEGLTSEQIRATGHDFDTVKGYWLRMQFALDICWATSVATVQLAFMRLYVRLYEGRRFARICCYVSILFITSWYIWSIVRWINMCHPPGRCQLQTKKSCILIGSLHVFYNAVILSAPLPAVFTAQVSSTKKKVSLSLLFLLGCFCTVLAVLRIDCAITVFGDVNADPIGASWWRVCFSPIEIAFGIICCCVPNVNPRCWNSERPNLPTEGTGLRRLKFRTTSGSSSTSNLNPAHWMPGPKPQVNAFVTLEKGKDKSMERITSLGPHEIQVKRDYQLDRDRL